MRLEVQIAELRAGTSRGFEAINTRLQDMQRSSTERHEENVARLEKIDLEVRRTNGRVTRLEKREEMDDWRDESDHEREDREDRDPQTITMPTLKWWLMIIGFTAAGTWGFMQLIGFHR